MGTLRLSYVMVIAQVGKWGQGNCGADGIPGRGVDGVAPQSDVKRFNLRGCPPFERREGWGSPLGVPRRELLRHGSSRLHANPVQVFMRPVLDKRPFFFPARCCASGAPGCRQSA